MRYFDKLFNEGSKSTIDFSNLNTLNKNKEFYFYHRISKYEVREALKKMKCGKTIEPEDIPIEVWKCLRDQGIS